ncbi:MAG: deoxyhypusine synthase [Euryarchaeota archaeon]|nr:deoxyhypusine synthase [Euryarchaeota archaeon]
MKLQRVEHVELGERMSVDELMRAYARAGVLGAGALGKACNILEEMVRSRATLFLGIAGCVVAGGMRRVITELIRMGAVSAVVTNGASVVHDVIEALGGEHYAGSFCAGDAELHERGIGRMGNVYTKVESFTAFEDYMQGLLGSMSEQQRSNLSIRELLSEIGASLQDRHSFLRAAHEMKVPVFSPAITDSMVGLQLFFFSQNNSLVLNAVKDMREMAQLVIEAERVGALFLGGGVPKHYILGACLLRGGIDYGIQITLDREEAGSLSGARLEEGISWGKTAKHARVVSVTGDVTLVLPLLVASLRERMREWSEGTG